MYADGRSHNELLLLIRNQTQLLVPMRNAILRFDATSSTLTSNHLLFLRSCIDTGLYRVALPILDLDIYSLPSDPVQGIDDVPLCADHTLSCTYISRASGISEELKIQHVQEYYSLGAHIYIGLCNFDRARLFLELALSIPTKDNAVNVYMLEAYKKLLLLGLMNQGRPYKISALVDQAQLKAIQSLSKAYEVLAEAFTNRDVQRFRAELETAGDLWRNDGNHGLVQHVAEALRRFRVIDLQRTYAALTVDRVAIHLSLSAEATAHLLTTMINDGHLAATIGQSDNASANNGNSASSAILRFLSPTAKSGITSNESIDAQIQTQLQKIELLSAFVKEADRRLAVSKEYTDWRKRQKASGAGAGQFEDPMDLSWEPPSGNAEDEDIMGQ